jgi:hypothetical protein
LAAAVVAVSPPASVVAMCIGYRGSSCVAWYRPSMWQMLMQSKTATFAADVA